LITSTWFTVPGSSAVAVPPALPTRREPALNGSVGSVVNILVPEKVELVIDPPVNELVTW
jgi:hypothetical protein